MFSPCVPDSEKKAGLAKLCFTCKDVDRNELQKAWGGGSYVWQVTIEQGFVRYRNAVSSARKACPTPQAGGRNNENFKAVSASPYVHCVP